MVDHGGVIQAMTGVTGGNTIISVYLVSPLHGTYSWDSQGNVTQTSFPK
jgi:hypothetical protein